MLLGELARRNARRYPEKTAVVSGSVSLSFEEFNCRVNSLANGLIALGLCREDRVAVLLNSSHRYLELYFAVPKAGGMVVPLNTTSSVPELAYILHDAGVTVLVFGVGFEPLVDSILAEVDSIKTLVAVDTSVKGAVSYEQLVASYPSAEPQVEVSEQDVAYLVYTSGTTGTPKGIMETHRGMIESALNQVLGCHLTEKDIGLVVTPLFWGATMVACVQPQVYVGGTLVIAGSTNPEAILELIQRERITTSFVPPSIITGILEHPQLDSFDVSSLSQMWIAGAPLPVEAFRRAKKVMGDVFYQSYGTTELGPLTTITNEEQITEGPLEKVRRLASCGREAVNVEVRVVDDDGRDVARGEVGEVITRGDNMMKGYWRMPQVTEEALKGGYFHTGDLATVDEEGYLYLVGRKKDLIISGGQTIYPVEVEEVIYQYPDVVEVAVIGVADEKLGESIQAVVAVRRGEKVTAEDILEFCRQRLPDYARPGSIVFMERLPRNPAGKILRRALREEPGSGG